MKTSRAWEACLKASAPVAKLDLKEKKAHVYLVQVTIAKTHKDSETNFYLKQWPTWKDTLSTHGFENPASTFVWVDMQGSSTKLVPPVQRDTRASPNRIVVDEHEQRHISIGLLDPKLEESLKAKGF